MCILDFMRTKCLIIVNIYKCQYLLFIKSQSFLNDTSGLLNYFNHIVNYTNILKLVQEMVENITHIHLWFGILYSKGQVLRSCGIFQFYVCMVLRGLLEAAQRIFININLIT